VIDLRSRWRALSYGIVLLFVLAMVGCVGVNAKNSQPTTPSSSSSTGQLSALTPGLSFGSVQLGASQNQSETITNTGSSTVVISSAVVNGTGYSLSGPTLPVTLMAGQSATFTVTFAPQASGNAIGNLSITSNASTPTLNLPLTGTGVAAGALTSNPSSLNFGSLQVSSQQTLTATLNTSSASPVTISQATVTGSGFSLSGLTLPTTVTASQSATFSITFAPTSAGAATGNLAIVSSASNASLNISLAGTAIAPSLLGANPSSVSFASVVVGSSKNQSVTLNNSGGSSLTISQTGVSGSGFSLSGLSAPLTLNAGQSATFSVIFAPTSAGTASGSVSLTSNASNPSLTIPLSGMGTTGSGQLIVNPPSISFGNVVDGTSQSRSATLSASIASVTVSSITMSGPEFSVTGISPQVIIAAGNSIPFTVTFTPQASGSASANATFTSNASNSPTVQSLSGTGTAPPQHSVALSWNASTSVVVGYNVYRGTHTGGPYTKINTVLQASTNYTDLTVSGGQSYYYVTTAVDANSLESAYSNEAQAVIPFP
jgi:Abnormal spindle-like microcephaly-assoc'd, ASPM-SPD-2-Hydin